MRVEDEGSAGIFEVGVGTTTIDSDGVGLIFHSSGSQQPFPMINADLGPVGDYDKKVGSFVGSNSKDFWKAKVVADKGADGEFFAGKGLDFIARKITAVFVVVLYRMQLGEFIDDLPLWIHGGGHIDPHFTGAGMTGSGVYPAFVLLGQIAQEFIGLRGFGDGRRLEIDAVSGGEHFGQYDQAAGSGLFLFQEGFRLGVVGFLVFPDLVHLDCVDFHDVKIKELLVSFVMGTDVKEMEGDHLKNEERGVLVDPCIGIEFRA